MSFGSVMFPTGTYTVTRTERGEYTQGRYASGAQSTLPIVADVQEVTGATLKDMPEGMRIEDTKVIYTTTELFAKSDPIPQASGPDEPGYEADVVEIDGAMYRVVKVQKFRVFARRFRVWAERVPA